MLSPVLYTVGLCTANILLAKNTTFRCVLFPMYFQCIFSIQDMLVVHETTALNTSKFGYFLLPYNKKGIFYKLKLAFRVAVSLHFLCTLCIGFIVFPKYIFAV